MRVVADIGMGSRIGGIGIGSDSGSGRDGSCRNWIGRKSRSRRKWW
jgi:hypothetical protein